jgi:predicted TPR repeat methyltransferase
VTGERFRPAKALFDQLADQGFSALARQHGYGACYDWIREGCAAHNGRRFRVLELGCGDGEIGAVLAEAGTLQKLVGIDFSPKMLERCRERGIYETLIEADLEEGLPDVGEHDFDLVIGCGVLEFVEDPSRLLRDLLPVSRTAELWLTFEAPSASQPVPESWKFPRTRTAVASLMAGVGYRVLSAEQRVAYKAVTGSGAELKSLGFDVEFVFVRARVA